MRRVHPLAHSHPRVSVMLTVVAVLHCVGPFLLLHCNPNTHTHKNSACIVMYILKCTGSIFTHEAIIA